MDTYYPKVGFDACVNAGCRDVVAIMHSASEPVVVVQHGANPEHVMVIDTFLVEAASPGGLRSQVSAWLARIHGERAT
jgi:hypothetical protein